MILSFIYNKLFITKLLLIPKVFHELGKIILFRILNIAELIHGEIQYSLEQNKPKNRRKK